MKKSKLPLFLLAAMALSGSAIAGPSGGGKATVPPVVEEESGSCCDDIWSLATLYKNDDSAFLQEFKLIGRYQGQYANVDSDQGDFEESWETRRFRLGAQAQLLNRVKLLAQINVNEEFNPLYSSIDEAYAQIKLGKDNKLTIGKQKPKFTHEYATSSKEIVTFERSLLVNQVTPDKSSGVTYSGKSNELNYSLGIYSGDGDDEFGGFDESIFTLLTVGTDLGFADWTLGYLYNDSADNNNAAAYRHAISNSLVFGGEGPFQVATDLIWADGFDGDAYGLVILPTYDITDKLQVVGRYQYAHGDNDTLRAQSRYERRVPSIEDGGRGEDYNAFYAGLNYYICGHKLKLMAGAEYADLKDGAGDGGDFEGWTLLTGVRMHF